MSHRRSPRTLDQALAALADELAPATLLAAVQRAWPSAVGPVIAAQARPTAERAGVVTVTCSASVWAAELDLMAPEIIEKLNRDLSARAIARLRFITTG